ncbi:MAG TPA: aminoacyl-tRNA hydrolase [Acidimicrobiaceae bacterium]|nr:aminoacyl-tRNA hydrolase [Acidimicrobiaceae bacterium]
MVVGLGNPGERFGATRHNVGADAARHYAARHCAGGEFAPDRRISSVSCRLDVAGRRVVVSCPTTFMNESGAAVRALVKRNGIADPGALVVLHDELDLEPGRVMVKLGGGTAGHNGLESVRAHLRTLDFVRVRIGVGKPPSAAEGANWVLRRPGRAERELTDDAVARAGAALDAIAADGVEAAMNVANAR